MDQKKLFVGNLNWDATELELKELFDRFGDGTTEVKIITDKETGRSRGFAFVTMKYAADAQTALDALNDTQQLGRKIAVHIAKEQERRGGGGGNRDRGGYDRRDSRR